MRRSKKIGTPDFEGGRKRQEISNLTIEKTKKPHPVQGGGREKKKKKEKNNSAKMESYYKVPAQPAPSVPRESRRKIAMPSARFPGGHERGPVQKIGKSLASSLTPKSPPSIY